MALSKGNQRPARPAGKRPSGRYKPRPSKPMVRTKEGKYSHRHGLYSTRNLDREAEGVVIPETIKHHLVANANASLSYNTWRGVKSVNRRIQECETETKVSLAFPWNNGHLLCFTGWCMERGLRDHQQLHLEGKSQSQSNLQLEISLPLTGLFSSNTLISQLVGTQSSLLLSIRLILVKYVNKSVSWNTVKLTPLYPHLLRSGSSTRPRTWTGQPS